MNPGAANATSRVPPDLVTLGILRGAYGLQGWIHVQPYSGEAEVLRATRRWWLLRPEADGSSGDPTAALQVTELRTQGAGLVAKWRGCEDPEAAQALKGWRIAVSRSDFPRLPQGQFYWVDLIGALVVNRSGLQLGVVRALRNNGAHDLLEVERESASAATRPLLIPMVEAYVDGVDLAARRIRVDWDAQW
ncbi:Ribosome maturation factor RimM [Burkholderiales bacterium]|jgi:16S rRNA processing protein RimM|nr:Ribosome maturation factor RimM [Burkholderiales bacterium]